MPTLRPLLPVPALQLLLPVPALRPLSPDPVLFALSTMGAFLARISHEVLGLQSAEDVNAPALAIIFAFLTIASTVVVTTLIQYYGWNTLVIEQYALSAGFQAGSTCTCAASFVASDVAAISLSNDSYYGLQEFAVSPYTDTLAALIPPGLEVTPDPLALVSAFTTQLGYLNSRVYEVGSFSPETFVNSTTELLINEASATFASIAAAATATNALQNNLITPVLLAYAALEFYAAVGTNATVITEIYNDIGTSFSYSQQLMKEINTFWKNNSDPFASGFYQVNSTVTFDINTVCATASCVLIRDPTSLERFESIITLLTSTFGLCVLISAVLVRQLNNLVRKLAGASSASSKPSTSLSESAMELTAKKY